MAEGLDSSLCVAEDDVFHKTNQVQPQNLSLLIDVIQSSGKSLPVSSYTDRLVTQMTDRVAGVLCDYCEGKGSDYRAER